MSQDNPNDLIEAVTAEIEAIIEEEINSQNLPAIYEEAATVPVSEPEQIVSEDKVEVESEEEHQPVDSTIEEIKTAAEKIEESSTPEIILTENQVKNLEPSSIIETNVNELSEMKEDIVTEYTVHIESPYQEKTSITECDERLAAVPLIETILKDAPIDENDGPRAKHFKQALRKALNNTVKSCRYLKKNIIISYVEYLSGEKLEGCFPFNLKADQFSKINETILNALKSVIDGVQVRKLIY